VGLIGAAALLATGCSGAARAPGPAPTGPPRGSGPAFEAARTECTQRATDATYTTNQQGIASQAAIGIYLECMKQKGFEGGTGN
jgi:hypothetical protein